MTLPLERRVAALLRETGSAHHLAFAATNGADPEWPAWYAEYLQPRLLSLTGRSFDAPALARQLAMLDAEQRREAPSEAWPDYYARRIVRDATSAA